MCAFCPSRTETVIFPALVLGKSSSFTCGEGFGMHAVLGLTSLLSNHVEIKTVVGWSELIDGGGRALMSRYGVFYQT